jgi:hypothetical protein
MSSRLLAVHGIWNHRPRLSTAEAEAEICRVWAAGLAANPIRMSDVELRAVYYAPQLRLPVRQGSDDGLDALSPEGRAWLAGWATELGAMPATTPQASWSIPARALADRMADHAGLNRLLVRPFVGAFLTEVGAYFRMRESVLDVVTTAIREYRPDVVLAHSLGSVVAYEALHAQPGVPVGLLVTLGSPLGLTSVVFDRLRPAPRDGHGDRPPAVRRWANIADPGDIVAIPRPFTRRFSPDANWDDTHIHGIDFHTVKRYLASARTADAFTLSGHPPPPTPDPTP